jgi:hypothetical protein
MLNRPSSPLTETLMSNTATPEEQLDVFINKFTPEIASLTREVRAIMRKRYPTALELVYDNYNALAIGFSPTERPSDGIFSIAVYPRWVSLFFLQGARLPDPKKILTGSGTKVKHIVLSSAAKLNQKDLVALMKQAGLSARVPFIRNGEHRLIIKSVSSRQRPRRPPAKLAK